MSGSPAVRRAVVPVPREVGRWRRRWSRWRWFALWSLPVLSLAWAGALYAYYGRVCWGLGRAPATINEHAGLQHGFHYDLVWLGLIIGIYYVPVWSLGVITALFSGRRTLHVATALAAAWAVPLFVWKLDPGGVFQWVLD